MAETPARETKELTTVGGHKVVYNAHLTGREVLNVIRRDKTGTNDMANSIDEAIEVMKVALVSLDDSSDNVVERVQDLNLEDYGEVAVVVKELLSGLKNFQQAK